MKKNHFISIYAQTPGAINVAFHISSQIGELAQFQPSVGGTLWGNLFFVVNTL